jgi:hypothetical protein
MTGQLVNAKARPSEATYNLESIEGGWIKVRRFTHGERVDRLGMILVMGISDDKEGGEAKIDHKAARLHDFDKAIIDHNLGDGNGKKYDFSKQQDVFDIDPTIGDEIDDLIGTHQEAIPADEVPNSEGNSPDST